MGKLSYNDKLRMQMLWQVSHCLVYAERLSQCGRLDCRWRLKMQDRKMRDWKMTD